MSSLRDLSACAERLNPEVSYFFGGRTWALASLRLSILLSNCCEAGVKSLLAEVVSVQL